MDNVHMIALLKDTAKLLELHGANPFQVRHYQNAAVGLEKIDQDVAGLPPETLDNIVGLQSSTKKLIQEMNATGTLQRWEVLAAATPQGVREMLDLRGIGPKKVSFIWKTLGITNLPELAQACEEGSVAALPGFGQKTQKKIQESIVFKTKQAGKFHYADALPYATDLEAQLQQAFPALSIALTGDLRRKLEVVDCVEVLIGTAQANVVSQWLDQQTMLQNTVTLSGPLAWRGQFIENSLSLIVFFCNPKEFYRQLILKTGSEAHLALPIREGKQLKMLLNNMAALPSEAAAYEQMSLPYIPPELREGQIELHWAHEQGAPALLEMEDLRGVFHSHTTYSDGKHSLAEMAKYCKDLGYAYIGITDHSQQAVYAGGLTPEAIREQHQEIDQLNEALAPFKIFKGIESDVLAAGDLDYPDDILSRFDFVIASIHTGLNMDQKKATARMIKAISNPYTTMLAHPTNRLLLKREGFPVDYRAVIDACADHGVIIEINANPWRLELDWRWVDYALSKNVWISINPDAHNKASIQNMYYGVCVGRKGGLTPTHTFNALSCEQVAAYLQRRKAKVITH
ncbi:MAG: PHP domain-containing protein [Bacteroidota bacterium]